MAIQRYLANPVIAPEKTRPLPHGRGSGWVLAGTALPRRWRSAAVSFVHFREKPPVAEVVRFEIGPPASGDFLLSTVDVSPDGRRVAFYAAGGTPSVLRLWVRSLDTQEARPLDVTFSGNPNLTTFWSPDGRYLMFANAGKLNKIDVTGGPPQPLCDAGDGPSGGLWTHSDNKIVFGTRSGLRQVSAAGGDSVPLTTVDHSRGEIEHADPSLLPDGRHLLYRRSTAQTESGIYLASLDAKPEAQSTKILLPGDYKAVYAPSLDGSGYVLFMRAPPSPSLMAQPFDARKLEPAGEAVSIAEQVYLAGFSASATGVLVYQTGSYGIAATNPTWYDRKGTVLGIAAAPDQYSDPALSPDEKRLAFQRADGSLNRDLWLT